MAVGDEPRARLATWVFLLSYFAAIVPYGVNQDLVLPTRALEVAVLGGLLALALIEGVERTVGRRILASFGVLLALAVTHELVRPASPDYGDRNAYLAAALGFCAIYGLTAFFGAMYFRPQIFAEIFLRISKLSAAVAVLAYAANRAADSPFLVNQRFGSAGDRLQGLLVEPAAWAPIVPAMLLLGRRRSDRTAIILGLAVLVLCQSPTVYAVTGVSLAVHALLATSWQRGRIPLLALVLFATAGSIQFVRSADSDRYVASSNVIEHSIGRLLVGIDALLDGSADRTTNARAYSTAVVISEVNELRSFDLGYGLNSSTVYFGAKYPGETGVRPNSIWVRSLFDLGFFLTVLLCTLLVFTVWRLRKAPGMSPIFAPMILSTAVNSAGGHQLFKVAVLGLLVFGLGWKPVAAALPNFIRRVDSRHEDPEGSLLPQTQTDPRITQST